MTRSDSEHNTWNNRDVYTGLVGKWKSRPEKIQGVPFNVSLNMAALLHGKRASAGTSFDSSHAEGHDERNAPCIEVYLNMIVCECADWIYEDREEFTGRL